MSSSMRNAVQRRNHRERAQPEGRKKWGILEKHKDYSARARDYNTKKAKLKALRQKAQDRNPDEFYFGMLSRKGPDERTGMLPGEKREIEEKIDVNVERLVKTQRLGQIRTWRNQSLKQVDLLEKRVAQMKGSKGKKMVFVDGEDEIQARIGHSRADTDEDVEFDTDAESDEDGDFLPKESKSGKIVFVEDKEMDRGEDSDVEGLDLESRQLKELARLERRLKAERKKLKVLTEAEEALDLQKARMTKTPFLERVTKQGTAKVKPRERKR